MINSNTDIETIASRLGHKDSTTTLKIYSHQLKKADKEISQKIEKLLE
jgi:integrase